MYSSGKTRKIKVYESFEDIFDLSLNILSRTDITVIKLRQKLLLKTKKTVEIERVIKRLCELGLLNDRERAKSIIEGHPSWSKLRLKQALYEKGVPKDVSEDFLAQIDEEDEKKRCARAFEKLRGAKEMTKENKLKIFNSLARRGFKAGMVASITNIDEDFDDNI